VLKDMQTFVAALDTMFGGFRERADSTYRLLQQAGTSFVVVAAPERDALREASYFVERLGEERMPLSGLVLNRVHTSAAVQLSAERALAGAETLAEQREHPVAAALLRLHADRMRVIVREQRLRGRFTAAHPRVPVVDVPAQPGDVHDLDGLRVIGAALAAS
jgi:anion-transporting  ArsA/GET3 family ATPase